MVGETDVDVVVGREEVEVADGVVAPTNLFD